MKTFNNFPVVEAYAINTKSIIFICPYTKKRTFHRHGSCGNLRSRMEHRASHSSAPELKGGYYIEINDDTPRAILGCNNQILKRGRKYLNGLLLKQKE
tara:strand:- start:3682 stop:3975 length:294 start_codon:yes stop_codon:yes gene_type:complete